MSHPYLLIVGIMAAAGIVGGGLNYQLAKADDPQTARGWQSFLSGIIASFLVPLFLNMISSNLLESIAGTNTLPSNPMKLFVFIGFCLVAAVSSKAFIRTISDRILSEAKATRQQVRQMKETVDTIVDKETEKEPQEISFDVLSVSADRASLDADALNVLYALTDPRFTFRTRSGIAMERALSKDVVSKSLEKLVGLGLVRQVKVPVEGKLKTRWSLTDKGRALATTPESGTT